MKSVKNVEFLAPATGRYAEILTPEAVAFVVGLQRPSTSGGRSCWRHGRRGRRGWMRGSGRIF